MSETNVLPETMLLSASLMIMKEALKNPERLTKSSFLVETDPNTVKTDLTKAMENCVKSEGVKRERVDMKQKLEEARQRRMMMENR